MLTSVGDNLSRRLPTDFRIQSKLLPRAHSSTGPAAYSPTPPSDARTPRDLQLPEDSIDSAHVAPAAWMPPFFLPLLLASLHGDTQVSHPFL